MVTHKQGRKRKPWCPKCREKIKEVSLKNHFCRTRKISREFQLIVECPDCKRKMTEPELENHNLHCHIKKLKEKEQERIENLTSTKIVKIEPERKQPEVPFNNKPIFAREECLYCRNTFLIESFAQHVKNCTVRHNELLQQESNPALSIGYVNKRNKCRLCGRPPMYGSDVCYSCSSD